ncbi:MAG: hypothetical protein ACRD1E_10915, partial [Terriglobales bacterium]
MPSLCPESETCAAVLDGTLAPAAAEGWLRHACGCEACGARLRQGAEAQADAAASTSETRGAAALAQLASSQAAGQRKLAQRLRRLSRPSSRRHWPWPYLAVAAGVAALVALSWAWL